MQHKPARIACVDADRFIHFLVKILAGNNFITLVNAFYNCVQLC